MRGWPVIALSQVQEATVEGEASAGYLVGRVVVPVAGAGGGVCSPRIGGDVGFSDDMLGQE